MCLRFQSTTQRRCPSQGGQPHLHMSPESRDRQPLDPASPSAANRCTPISAHALSVSAETKGLERHCHRESHRSFLMRKKKSSPCGPYFPSTFQQLDDVRERTTTHGSRQGQTPSHPLGPFPCILQNLRAHNTAGHCNHHDWQPSYEPKASTTQTCSD